ncbi:PAS domain S-box-containing protein [Rhodobium orientis]|uniref:hybrid sensor histidine kinase/response regulator n=1 Tax=Rhodobium orientis TaxID=34017 RepID=UPI001475694C|nr:PAS domain-containing hybrid sensor histidine kinase/response regulator [Rhodobium orientis]MBB4303163.1 PAS domain S-box-containing protein [Rhodobium orientis]
MSAVAALLVFLGLQISQELKELRNAPRDNVQWTAAQLEVELLTLLHAIDGGGKPVGLDDIRKRFDIFYSRVVTIESSSMFAELRASEHASSLLGAIRGTLDRLVPLIDGPDPALRENRAELLAEVTGLRPLVRGLSLESVDLFARTSDNRRQMFTLLLIQTAVVAGLLIVVLAGTLLVLWRQYRVSMSRSGELSRSSQRYANTIDVSLDAIIVADAEGTILDFNPAAERTFGYSRNAAMGRNISRLIVPEHLRTAHVTGMKRFLKTGEKKVLGQGRVELEAMRANGEDFPVELSLGVASESENPTFIAYLRDISDRRRTQQELTEARDRALSAAEAKSQFLAVMSHEMRTPLNGVLGVLDLMRGTRLSQKQRQYVETAIASGELLRDQIDDVLDLSSLEAGGFEPHPVRFEIGSLLYEIVDLHSVATEARGNQLVVSLGFDSLTVSADRRRIRQILLNLVSNAVKFTRDGMITMEANELFRHDGQAIVELAVSDTGAGIAAADIDRVFEDFVTLDPSFRRTTRGTGLGLAICRRMARAMDGEIGVESTPGHGSRFWVRLPLPLARGEHPAPVPSEAAADEALEGKAGLKVLVVEDNATNRFVAGEMLARAGCRVKEAENGEVGVDLANKEAFDIILMDISMPLLDGLEATRRIRSSDGPCRDTPIIGLTAHVFPEEQDKLRLAGMQDALIKPLRLRQLNAVLAPLLRERPAASPPPAAEKPAEAEPATEATSDRGTALIDEDIVGDLKALLPPEKLVQHLDKFCAELVAIKESFEAARHDETLKETCQFAHRLAGSAALFGATRLRQVLLEIEDACFQRDDEPLPALIEAADVLGRQTMAALEPYRAAA